MRIRISHYERTHHSYNFIFTADMMLVCFFKVLQGCVGETAGFRNSLSQIVVRASSAYH